jgi:hypothetical protein
MRVGEIGQVDVVEADRVVQLGWLGRVWSRTANVLALNDSHAPCAQGDLHHPGTAWNDVHVVPADPSRRQCLSHANALCVIADNSDVLGLET